METLLKYTQTIDMCGSFAEAACHAARPEYCRAQGGGADRDAAL